MLNIILKSEKIANSHIFLKNMAIKLGNTFFDVLATVLVAFNIFSFGILSKVRKVIPIWIGFIEKINQ